MKQFWGLLTALIFLRFRLGELDHPVASASAPKGGDFMAPLNDAVAGIVVDLRNAALLAAVVVVLLWLIWQALQGRWRG